MKRSVQIVVWAVTMIVLGLVVARWPRVSFYLAWLAITLPLGLLVWNFGNNRGLPKFSLRTSLLVFGLIGCWLAFSKQREPWERVHSFPGHVSNVAMSPDGSLVAASVGTTIEIRDTKTGKHLKTLEMPADEAATKKNTLWYCEFAFSQDNTKLLTAGWREQVHLYDWNSGKSIRSWTVGSMSRISRSGRRFATHVGSGEYYVYDVDHSEPVQKVQMDQPKSRRYSQLSATGKYLVVANNESEMELWNVETGNRCFEMPTRFVNPYMLVTSFSPDEKRIAIPVDGGIAIWNIEQAEQVGEWKPTGFSHLGSMEWSPNGTRLLATYIEMIGPSTPVPALATSSNRNAVHHCYLLDSQAEEISKVVGNSATFTASGDRVATVYGSCNILDGGTGELLARVPHSNPMESAIGYRSLFFSPDGDWLFTNGTHGFAAVFKRTRSERWHSVLSIPAYWGMIIFFVLLGRETFRHARAISVKQTSVKQTSTP